MIDSFETLFTDLIFYSVILIIGGTAALSLIRYCIILRIEINIKFENFAIEKDLSGIEYHDNQIRASHSFIKMVVVFLLIYLIVMSLLIVGGVCLKKQLSLNDMNRLPVETKIISEQEHDNVSERKR